jgi:hypothetical protein
VKEQFKTQQRVPVTGLYRITHGNHRLPHEALPLAGEILPRCARCSDQVQFELLTATPAIEPAKIARVYELPVLEEEDDTSALAG